MMRNVGFWVGSVGGLAAAFALPSPSAAFAAWLAGLAAACVCMGVRD